MSCSVFVHINYSKELEQKIKKLPGIDIQIKRSESDYDRIRIPAELFLQHKKEDDAHKWVKSKGSYHHYQQNVDRQNNKKWEYLTHGFTIWIGFEGDIVLVSDCHWNSKHGEQTLIDLKKWIKDNFGDIEIKEGRVSP